MPRWNLNYHFVWSTKQRARLIIPTIRESLYHAIRYKAIELKGRVHALNGLEEHVHLVVSLLPSICPATFIGQVKGFSSHSMLNHPGRVSLEPFRWQDEYSVDTVSERALADVIRYVENQQSIHALRNLRRELENW